MLISLKGGEGGGGHSKQWLLIDGTTTESQTFLFLMRAKKPTYGGVGGRVNLLKRFFFFKTKIKPGI